MAHQEEGFWKQPGNLERLAVLWEDRSLSAAKIGELLGCTKNAVVSAVHRYDLPPRVVKEQAEQPRANPFDALRQDSCRYPMGNPGDSGFHFCCDPVLPGYPYCKTHKEKCYIGVWSPSKRAKLAAAAAET